MDVNKSIEVHEGVRWKDPVYASYLVKRVHDIRKIPLKDLTAEDLRITIAQGEALTLLVPLAMELLRKDLLTAGDYYPGDLLHSVLHIEKGFWSKHPALRQELHELVERQQDVILQHEELSTSTIKWIMQAYLQFK